MPEGHFPPGWPGHSTWPTFATPQGDLPVRQEVTPGAGPLRAHLHPEIPRGSVRPLDARVRQPPVRPVDARRTEQPSRKRPASRTARPSTGRPGGRRQPDGMLRVLSPARTPHTRLVSAVAQAPPHALVCAVGAVRIRPRAGRLARRQFIVVCLAFRVVHPGGSQGGSRSRVWLEAGEGPAERLTGTPGPTSQEPTPGQDAPA